VIAAATGLFVERGYGVTTIDAIAEAARRLKDSLARFPI
jgi:AcrR family transcriptional regulator